jgi:translocation and assembly module TamB
MRVSTAMTVVVRALLLLLLLVALALVALPLWLPWAAAPVLSRLGVAYNSYERVGYHRFALTDVRYRDEQVEVEAGRIEGFLPFGWLWHRWRETGEVDFVAVHDWRVVVRETGPVPVPPPEEAPEEREEISVFETVGTVEEVVAQAVRWVPRARLTDGLVEVAGRRVAIPEGVWNEGRVLANGVDKALQQTVFVDADLRGGLPFVLSARTDPLPFSTTVTVSRSEGRLAVRSESRLAGNLLVADADFPQEGFLPERAVFRSDEFRLPAEYFAIEGYEDVAGSLLFEWDEDAFTARLRGGARPSPGREDQLPPLRVEAAARGDLQSFVVDAMEVRSPWLAATLSSPVALDYAGELLTETSVFELAADLAEQPFVDLRGRLRGEARIFPGDERLPVIEFDLFAEDVAGFELELARVEASGALRWPELSVARLEVEAADRSRAVASGGIDFDAMAFVGVRVTGEIGPRLISPWLPEGIAFTQAGVDGLVEGPLAAPRHRGELAIEELFLPRTRRLDGNLKWEGERENLAAFNLVVTAGDGRLSLDGSSERAERRLGLVLQQFRLERAGEAMLESARTARFALSWVEDEPLNVSVQDLHLTGPVSEVAGAADIVWPLRGTFSLGVEGISTDLIADFLDLEAESVEVVAVEAAGSWDEGPILFQLVADIRLDVDQPGPILVELDLRGEQDVLHIDRLRASSGEETLAMAEGFLPVAFWPERLDLVRIRGGAPIQVSARVDPGARFWQQVGEWTGVFLDDPRLSLEISGTPYEPHGYIRGDAPRLRLPAGEARDERRPVLENLRLETVIDVDGVHLEELSVSIDGQRVLAEAVLHMGPEGWRRAVQEREVPDWRQAQGRLTVPRADLAAFTRYAPGILSPQGTIQADIAVLPGAQLDGTIVIDDVATRPLMPLGTIRDGSARLVLRDRTAHLEEISAIIGGERVTLSGTVDVPFEQPLAFDLRLRGNNIPLTRRPGVVVRGDLNLSARSQEGEIPVIGGGVNLRNSYYFAALRLMPAGGVATPQRRPPFFSIDQEPFANWRLNVDLRGPNFLEVRGPIFQGTLSANFNLSGTLEEPRAIGAATLDEGRLRFPFATLAIDQGEVALRREDPFQPQLFVAATGMSFGYDLRMEVTGTAETPIIEFIANPPLTSEQALLMVTTGELPRDEIRFTTQQRATRFAVYFGRNFLYELTDDDTAADRLIIRTGEQVSEGGRETMAIEYKLTDRWSLTGEYDRFDEYNVGVKWRIYSR